MSLKSILLKIKEINSPENTSIEKQTDLAQNIESINWFFAKKSEALINCVTQLKEAVDVLDASGVIHLENDSALHKSMKSALVNLDPDIGYRHSNIDFVIFVMTKAWHDLKAILIKNNLGYESFSNEHHHEIFSFIIDCAQRFEDSELGDRFDSDDYEISIVSYLFDNINNQYKVDFNAINQAVNFSGSEIKNEKSEPTVNKLNESVEEKVVGVKLPDNETLPEGLETAASFNPLSSAEQSKMMVKFSPILFKANSSKLIH